MMMNPTEPTNSMQEQASSFPGMPVVVIQHEAPQDACFGWGDFPAVTTSPLMLPTAPDVLPSHLHLVEDSMESSTSSYASDESSAMDISSESSVTSSYDSLTKQNEQRRLVQFGSVQVQEHAVILGDHPLADEYPLSLDWKHKSPMHYEIDDYEDHYRKNTTCFLRASSSKSFQRLPQRLSPADRRLRLAAVNGESVTELCQREADRRRQQLQGSLSISTLSTAVAATVNTTPTSNSLWNTDLLTRTVSSIQQPQRHILQTI